MAPSRYEQQSGALDPIGSLEKTAWLYSLPTFLQSIILEDWTEQKLIDPAKLPEIVPLIPARAETKCTTVL